MSKTYWAKRVFKKAKKGALHEQLGISKDEKIPRTLMREIKETPIGKTAHNPTKVGKRGYKVTPKMKKRATLAYTAGGWN